MNEHLMTINSAVSSFKPGETGILPGCADYVEASNTSLQASKASLLASNALLQASNASLLAGNTPLLASNAPLQAGNASLQAGNAPLLASNASLQAGNTPLPASNASLQASNALLLASNALLLASGTLLPVGALSLPGKKFIFNQERNRTKKNNIPLPPVPVELPEQCSRWCGRRKQMEDQTTSIDQPNQKQQAGETGTEDEGTKKRYKTRTFGVRVLEAELMTAGITNHSEPLTPHGFGGEYVTSFEQFIQDLKDTNKDQERIKAQQKEKTAELNGKLK
ncbi:MAG: hypothetical protein GY940_37170, partial [bacterium]|nr:hypothetical protein [bacterium]